MKILLKDDSVKFKEINKYTMTLFQALGSLWKYQPREPVITSANDGKHMADSLHYKNRAWDLRSRDLNEVEQIEFVDSLKKYLGNKWDVILEKDHIHLEADRV